MLQLWEAFSSGCFSESPLAALITGPGAALWARCAHACSWEKAAHLILTTRTKTTHTNTHARAHARARLSPRNQSASCSGTFLSSLLQLRLHRQQQPVTLRTTWAGFKTWLFVYFLNPHLAQHLRSEDVERRCSCQTSVKLLSVSGAHTEGKSWTRSPCVGHRRRWETSTRLSPRKHHGCRR